jgi:hypothetical protein
MLKILAILNEPIYWITPAGMKIWGRRLPINPSLLEKRHAVIDEKH